MIGNWYTVRTSTKQSKSPTMPPSSSHYLCCFFSWACSIRTLGEVLWKTTTSRLPFPSLDLWIIWCLCLQCDASDAFHGCCMYGQRAVRRCTCRLRGCGPSGWLNGHSSSSTRTGVFGWQGRRVQWDSWWGKNCCFSIHRLNQRVINNYDKGLNWGLQVPVTR